MDSTLPEEVLAMIGAEKVRRYDVTERDIRRFSQAIGETNPIHFDEDYAKRTRHGTIIAPPLFCQMFTFEDVPAELERWLLGEGLAEARGGRICPTMRGFLYADRVAARVLASRPSPT